MWRRNAVGGRSSWAVVVARLEDCAVAVLLALAASAEEGSTGSILEHLADTLASLG